MKKKMMNRNIVILILVAVLIGLVGVGGYLLSRFSKEPGTTIHLNSKGDHLILADGEPFIVRGVCYSPVPTGEGHLYNWWGDANKPWMVDGKLMQEAGINTVRFYEPGGKPKQVKKVISDLYKDFGIRSIMGHGLGFWEYPHANYADPEFQHRIKREVYQMVKTYKNEPGVVAWVLGNEANYSFDGKINPWSTPELDAIKSSYDRKLAKAKIYYTFLNELAQIVKKVDPGTPVGFGNGELGSIEVAKEYCPDFDFVGIIIYRGKSFGNLFRQLKTKYGKPAIMIEFGCDSYNAASKEPDEGNQAFFLKTLWCEVEYNTYAGKGEGNSLGGCVFEWNDEWWKFQQDKPSGWLTHNAEAGWSNGSYYYDIQATDSLNMNEEWWGIISLSDVKENGLNKRIPKKSYYALQKIWQEQDKAEACDWR
ncbi:glycoside hydrolase family 2 TIM barrel-domain containing protein [Candidatus Omnitrophota bacterium]